MEEHARLSTSVLYASVWRGGLGTSAKQVSYFYFTCLLKLGQMTASFGKSSNSYICVA